MELILWPSDFAAESYEVASRDDAWALVRAEWDRLGQFSGPLALRGPSGPLASPRGIPDTHRRPYGLQRAPWGRAEATGGQADQERGGEGSGEQATSCNALSEGFGRLALQTSADGF